MILKRFIRKIAQETADRSIEDLKAFLADNTKVIADPGPDAKRDRAFCDPDTKYYMLTENLGGILPRGTIFYHDPDDSVRGSIANGCLKNCWTPDGNVYGSICANTVVFHTSFIESGLFSKAVPK